MSVKGSGIHSDIIIFIFNNTRVLSWATLNHSKRCLQTSDSVNSTNLFIECKYIFHTTVKALLKSLSPVLPVTVGGCHDCDVKSGNSVLKSLPIFSVQKNPTQSCVEIIFCIAEVWIYKCPTYLLNQVGQWPIYFNADISLFVCFLHFIKYNYSKMIKNEKLNC